MTGFVIYPYLILNESAKHNKKFFGPGGILSDRR